MVGKYGGVPIHIYGFLNNAEGTALQISALHETLINVDAANVLFHSEICVI